jgi:hypothetical protein
VFKASKLKDQHNFAIREMRRPPLHLSGCAVIALATLLASSISLAQLQQSQVPPLAHACIGSR